MQEMFVWRCVLLNCCQVVSDCRIDLEHFLFWLKTQIIYIYNAKRYHFVLNFFICFKAWSFSSFWSIYIYIYFFFFRIMCLSLLLLLSILGLIRLSCWCLLHTQQHQRTDPILCLWWYGCVTGPWSWKSPCLS